jgi:hypothetical protein
MYCVELLLPLVPGLSQRRRQALIDEVRQELTHRFGGVTAFVRSPAEGAWRTRRGTVRDDIVVVEVMVPSIDRRWWTRYRRDLEQRFDQEEIVIRAVAMQRL